MNFSSTFLLIPTSPPFSRVHFTSPELAPSLGTCRNLDERFNEGTYASRTQYKVCTRATVAQFRRRILDVKIPWKRANWNYADPIEWVSVAEVYPIPERLALLYGRAYGELRSSKFCPSLPIEMFREGEEPFPATQCRLCWQERFPEGEDTYIQ